MKTVIAPDLAAQARQEDATLQRLATCGLRILSGAAGVVRTGPQDFAQRYPATGGALYGTASHGWMASFKRPGARSQLPGLYLAGGSAHPGPGVPMAALSGGHRRRQPAARPGGHARPAHGARCMNPAFNTQVPRGGYAWWYLDALSDDGQYGLTVIAFIGSVFSPYYAWARRRGHGLADPLNHCALNVALYATPAAGRAGAGP
jgi:hypothetical protein